MSSEVFPPMLRLLVNVGAVPFVSLFKGEAADTLLSEVAAASSRWELTLRRRANRAALWYSRMR